MQDPASPNPRVSAAQRRLWTLAALFLTAILISFLLQLPTWRVADWGQFAFYDPGTTLKGDALLAKGYTPTIDFGYTHGLLSLLYGRLGFALLGRTPSAFLTLTLFTELVMAWAIARILVAAGISRKGALVFLAALPMAIMPAYLTLTHPLEAMFILLGLAAQAEGKRVQALVLATVCLFVKPSMAYVYGFLLTVIIIWNIVRHSRVTWSERLFSILRQLFPAAVTGITLFIALSLWFGPAPVLRSLLPIAGARTYSATHFGFFTENGRAFWLTATSGEFFITPAFAYILAAAASLFGALGSAWMLIRRPVVPATQILSRQRAWEILLTAGLLNTAFLLGFYGWPGSWTYYSYLPSLGLAAVTVLVPVRRNPRLFIAVAVIALLLLSHTQLIGTIFAAWRDKSRSPDTAGLWAYPDQFTEWQEALQSTRNQNTLVFTNGWIPQLPPHVSLPDAWFPEAGIPTTSELARIKAQAQASQCVILWKNYRPFEDAWDSPELTPLHDDFKPIFTGKWFTVLQRTTPQPGTQ
ncbi:MAG TPA: hypothetical protein VM008_01375 [Phycisphaerae bacterium]|nr:hypothetical protein [Phycisphaerae bacterium]